MAEKREKPHWEGKHYSFFQNTECEYFPCHRIADPARFNCLFCYCPLYMLGPRCGGNFRYTEKGIKDCTNCVIPHLPENYGRITGRYKEIAAKMPGPELSPAVNQEENEEIFGRIGPAAEQGPERADADVKNVKAANEKNVPDGREGRSFKRIVMMACTERGFDTMRRAAAALTEVFPDSEILQTGRCGYVSGFEDGPRLSEATARWFHETDALIFFSATGIAVRCIAPFARDKFKDPAVLVMDENGKFAIALMSGHAGGANRLCELLAKAVGAQPVITTATDGRGLFAADVFAAENGLSVSDRIIAKQISARILAGEILNIYFGKENSSALNSLSKYGEGIRRVSGREDADIIVSCRRQSGDRENALYLIPRTVTLGIGCRKGISADAVRRAVRQTLHSSGVFCQALSGIASIDLKKEEAGLHTFAQEWKLPLIFYTAQELLQLPGIFYTEEEPLRQPGTVYTEEAPLRQPGTVYTEEDPPCRPGTFSSSDFVRSITGVDCVCERSAVRLALDYAGGHENDKGKSSVGTQGSDGEKSAAGTQGSSAPQDHAGGQNSSALQNHAGGQNSSALQNHAGGQFENAVFLLEKKKSLDGVTTALAVGRNKS